MALLGCTLAVLAACEKKGEVASLLQTMQEHRETDSILHPQVWQVNRKQSEMDASRVVMLSRYATDVLQYDDTQRPRLTICCDAGKLEVIVSYNRTLSYDSQVAMRLRFDSATAIGQLWWSSTDREAAFADAPARVLRLMLRADTLRVEAKTERDGPLVARFGLDGLRDSLPHLQQDCPTAGT